MNLDNKILISNKHDEKYLSTNFIVYKLTNLKRGRILLTAFALALVDAIPKAMEKE
jgi:hypothetical protein